MARTESEQLVFSVEARISAMEKQMARAGRVTDKAFTGMENRSRRASRTMEKEMANGVARVGSVMKNFGRGIFAGMVAGGVVGIVGRLGQVASGIASIRDEAQKAGLATKAFQEWKYVAEQARIPVDSIADAFKELNIRADEFVTTGKGSAAEAFARLGMTQEEVQQKLRNPSELMLELIERTKALRNTAAGTRIFDELFGGSGGERMVSLLRQGEGEIRNQIKAANDLGIVIDDKLIDAADELDRKFRTITTTVSTGLKTAIVEAAGALQTFIDRFRQVEARQTATLQSQLKEAERNLKAAQERGIMPSSARQKQIEASQREIDRLRQVLRDRTLESIRPQLQSLSEGGVATKGDRPGYVPPVADTSATRQKNAGAAKTERDAVAELIAELQEELRLVGASSTEKEIAATLRRANVDAASAEGQQIAALVTEIERETEALEKNRQAQEARTQAIENMFGMGVDALTSIVDGSMKAEDAVKKLATQLALAAAQAALLGSGPLAGIFGGGGCLGGTTTFTNFTGARS